MSKVNDRKSDRATCRLPTAPVPAPVFCLLPPATCRLPPATCSYPLPSATRRLLSAVCRLLLLSCLWLLPSAVTAQQIADRMIATVNGGIRTDLITYSDLMWQLALQPNVPLVNPNSKDLNRALRLVIDQRLILQEAEKLPSIAPSEDDVRKSRDLLVKEFSSPSDFQRRLLQVGLTSDKLNEILAQRLRIEKYLDFRFRNFVLITQKEITDYYQNVYVPRLRARSPGQIVPTLEEARNSIETELTEAKIESDTDAFLDGARERAEIITLSPP